MRRYSNTAVATTITAAIDATQTTIPLAAVTGWIVPGAGDSSLAQIDGEIIEYTGLTGLTLTGCLRGVDTEGDSTAAHASGAAVVHVGSAADLEKIHTHAAATTGVHGIADTAALVLTDDARLSGHLVLISETTETATLRPVSPITAADTQASGTVAGTTYLMDTVTFSGV